MEVRSLPDHGVSGPPALIGEDPEMRNLLRTVLSARLRLPLRGNARASHTSPAYRPRVDPLEDRSLLSYSPVPPGIAPHTFSSQAASLQTRAVAVTPALLPDLSGVWHGPLTETNPLGSSTYDMTLRIIANPKYTSVFTGTMQDNNGNSSTFVGSIDKTNKVVINIQVQGMFVLFQLVGTLNSSGSMSGTVFLLDSYGGVTRGTFAFGRGQLDVAVTALTWSPTRDGVWLDYRVSGLLPTTRQAVINLYWSNGSKTASLGTPIFSTPILAAHTRPINVPFAQLFGFPRGTKQIVAIADPGHSLSESNLANNCKALNLPVITFKKDPDARSDVVTPYTLRVLTEVLVKANEPSALITSTMRTPDQQATIMYNSLEAHKISSYKAPGQKVIALYYQEKKQGLARAQIIADMTALIITLGPSTVSKHCVTLADYALTNVLDVAPTSLRNGARFAKVARSFFPRVSKILDPNHPKNDPVYDPAYHLEFPQPSLTGENM
jgi:hypothetical protein